MCQQRFPKLNLEPDQRQILSLPFSTLYFVYLNLLLLEKMLTVIQNYLGTPVQVILKRHPDWENAWICKECYKPLVIIRLISAQWPSVLHLLLFYGELFLTHPTWIWLIAHFLQLHPGSLELHQEQALQSDTYRHLLCDSWLLLVIQVKLYDRIMELTQDLGGCIAFINHALTDETFRCENEMYRWGKTSSIYFNCMWTSGIPTVV